MKQNSRIILSGALVGLASVMLVALGNPANMGVCIACFIRDIAGALGLHRAETVQYIRPEIIGILLGAMATAMTFGEFKSKGGSSPFTRFVLGATVMVGALVFLGCPLRMVLRLAAGDLNALVGLVGFSAGIGIGIFFLNKGFSLNRSYNQSKLDGLLLPVLVAGLGALLLIKPAFIFFSAKGPGSLHAPMLISLAVGLLVGFVSQRTRLCMVGGIRDLVLFKDTYLISGFAAILVFAALANLGTGHFKLGFAEQPIAHADSLWNFAGMLLAGWGSVLLGGCPLRQLILSGEGNSDSAVTVAGMLTGAALAHNFGLAASPKGVPAVGQTAVLLLLFVVAGISIFNSEFLMAKSTTEGGKQSA